MILSHLQPDGSYTGASVRNYGLLEIWFLSSTHFGTNTFFIAEHKSHFLPFCSLLAFHVEVLSSYINYSAQWSRLPAAIAHELSVDLQTKPVYFHRAFYGSIGGAIIIITHLMKGRCKIPLHFTTGKFEKVGRFPQKVHRMFINRCLTAMNWKHLPPYYRGNSVLDNDFVKFIARNWNVLCYA